MNLAVESRPLPAATIRKLIRQRLFRSFAVYFEVDSDIPDDIPNIS